MKRIGTIRDILIFVLVICTIGANQARAKSVYAITDHELSTLKAYMIDGDQLEYQEDVNVTDYALGAVGITIDSNLELLFITYEDAGKIVWANAKTLEQEGFIDLSSVTPYGTEFAGIVVDEGKQKIYAMARNRDQLYTLAWNANQKKLVLMDPNDPNQPYSEGNPYVTLTGLQTYGGWGIALDENTRRLYVANTTTNVNVYDADDPNWTHLGTRDVGREAMAVAVDPNNGQHNAYLYVGGFQAPEGGYHTFLVKHDLEADANPNTEQNINSVATGLAVDQDTGLVYCTTAEYSPDYYEVRVYDCSIYPFTCTYWVDTGGTESGPAGVCVPTGDVSYKPPIFYIEKIDINEPNYVVPGDDMTYMIIYGPNGYDHPNTVITDYLPFEVQYLSSDPCGTYNPDNHTITWESGSLDADDPNDFVTLTVKVYEYAEPNETFTNYCEIESDNGYSHTEYVTYLCCASNLFPACGATVDLYINGLKLTWCPGHFAADVDGHDVYFGTDYNSVLNANNGDQTGIYRGRQTETEYELTNLELHTTYYWRIDEVNESNVCQGLVLSFTTGDFYVIDDFEYYTVSDPEGTGTCPYYDGNDRRIDLDNDMRYWWLDGHVQKNPQGDCGTSTESWNPLYYEGSNIRLPGSRIIRTDSARSGDYGMSYFYDNNDVDNIQFPPETSASENKYSEILRYYAGEDGVDLTVSNTIDVNLAALGLFFLGWPDNDCNSTYDRMYVGLRDTNKEFAYIDHPDPNAAQVTDWTPWTIRLKEFTTKTSALDLHHIRSVRIGFGKQGNPRDGLPGGEGTVIFDDIRLYPYCSQADLDSDCDVDFYDYAKFASAWLTSSGQPNYDPNCDLAESNMIDCNDLALFCEDWLSGAGWNLQQSMMSGRGAGSGLEQSAYSVSLFEQAKQLEQQPAEVEPADIERLLEFLEEIWLTEPQIRETISEQDWNEFIESLKDYQ